MTYQQYGNQEVVPYEYIRAVSKAAAEVSSQRGTRSPMASASDVVNARALRLVQGEEEEFVIPDHLKVLDTDTEKERKRKRKAVKAIKNNFRMNQYVAAESCFTCSRTRAFSAAYSYSHVQPVHLLGVRGGDGDFGAVVLMVVVSVCWRTGSRRHTSQRRRRGHSFKARRPRRR